MTKEKNQQKPHIIVQAPSSSDHDVFKLPASGVLSRDNTGFANIGSLPSQVRSSDNVSSSYSASPVHPRTPSPSTDESHLSETELRRLYDDEEIERFLRLFSEYVSEVVIPPPERSQASNATLGLQSSASSSRLELAELATPSPPSSSINVELSESQEEPMPPPLPKRPGRPAPTDPERSISELIAFNFILPYLPSARPRPERFTIGRLRIASQRLFLVTQAAYVSFFSRLLALAAWKNKRKSLAYCILFWTLWYNNLLLSALFCRIFFSLLRRKVLPYPTAQELRERREGIARAEELGERLQSRLSAPSSGLAEAWRLFRLVAKSNKQNLRYQQEKLKSKRGLTKSDSAVDLPGTDETTVLDEPDDDQEEKGVKMAALNLLNDLADLHERIRNLFLWRRPRSSVVFSGILVFLVFFMYLLPTKYIVKLATFIIGVLFWHVVPIIAVLPAADRARLPPLFENSPTDAEYAMELISQRIARGEEIRPIPERKAKKRKDNNGRTSRLPGTGGGGGERSQVASDREDAETSSGEKPANPEWSSGLRHREIDWKRWGKKAASMKARVNRRQENVDVSCQSGESRTPNANTETDAHTFLAYHKASPGLLVLTSSMLLYTPITSSRPKIEVALTSLRGVKKIGIGAVPGLSVKWEKSFKRDALGAMNADAREVSESEVVEEKFQWVGGRDELFARLVGWGGRKWLNV